MVRFAAQPSKSMAPVSKRFRPAEIEEEDMVCSSSPHEGARNNEESYFSARFDPDVLECNICLESLASPIFQCENGHVACSSCCQKLSNVCPSCQKLVGTIRCLGLEKLIESLHVTCKYAEYGCPQMPKFSSKKDHEIFCKHMPFTCPTGGGCTFVGPVGAFPEHFWCNHGFPMIKLDYGAWSTLTLSPNDSFVLLKTEDELFVLCNDIQSLGGAMYVMIFGDVAREDDFEYELSVDKGKTKFKLAATVCSVIQNDKQGLGGYLVIPRIPEKSCLAISVIIRKLRVCFR